MRETSDQELVAFALAGQTAAFETLVRRHQQAVRRWLRRLGSDAALADDAAQDAFVRAWQRLGDYRGSGSFRAWLYRIAYSQFLQALRSRRSRQALQERLQQEELVQEEYPEPAHEDSHAQPDMERLLAILSLEERACLLLCYGEGYSHGEISDLLNLPLGTVKSHIRRGVLRIRERFGIEV